MILLKGLLESIVYNYIEYNKDANIRTKFELSFFYRKTIILMVKIKPIFKAAKLENILSRMKKN